MQSRQFFEITLPEQLFELKMKTSFKNLRIYATQVLAKVYPSNTMHGPNQTSETVPLNIEFDPDTLQPPPPRFWAPIRGRYWSAKIDDIRHLSVSPLTPSLPTWF